MTKPWSSKDDLDWWRVFARYKSRLDGAADFLARVDDSFGRLANMVSSTGSKGTFVYISGEQFKESIANTLEAYSKIKERIGPQLSKLDDEEKLRIEEAYHTLCQDCFWSSVVNCAVALEKRLFEILKSRNSAFMESARKDLQFTLGQLVGLYIQNKKEFNECIPAKHDNLMGLVSDYRIISVHAKQSDVDRTTADAIFNLTLKFLMDDECRPIRRGRKKTQ